MPAQPPSPMRCFLANTSPVTGYQCVFSRGYTRGDGAVRRAGGWRGARVFGLAVLVLLVGTGLTGCLRAAATGAGAAGRLDVVATTPVVADFVGRIGGGRVSVTQILRPNVDPHDYEPSPADLLALARADVVVRSGAGLESWLAPTIANSGFAGLLVDASRGVPLRRHDGQTDPHIWHDPDDAAVMCRNIATGLSARDPAGRATYRANLVRYLSRLDALDRRLHAEIDRIPPRSRILVTNHDAFGYYGRHFGLAVDPVLPSFDTSAELSGRDIGRVVARIRHTGVPAVFSESSLPGRVARTIGEEAGVRVVAGAGSLYADTLGPPGSAAATYLGMERHNTDVIVDALS